MSFDYSDEQLKSLLSGIFDGSIDQHNLPEDLYKSIAEQLKAGLYKGYGGGLSDFSGKDLELLNELRENIYMFSAAKEFHQVGAIRDLMFDKSGDLVGQREFNRLGALEFDKWNNSWGATEYNTAIAQGTMASKWNEIQRNKDLLPFLQYQTIGDACDICAPLDGLTAKVDDEIWNSVYPTNHFNCLCIVTQEDDTVTVTTEDEKSDIVGAVESRMQDTFKMNAGKDGYVFSPEHPYFTVEPKDRDFARENFGLPIPTMQEELGKHKFEPEIFEKWGTKIDRNVLNLLIEPIKVEETKGGSYARLSQNLVRISTPNLKAESQYILDKNIAHEIGHISHNQNNIITNSHISEEYKAHFLDMRKMVAKANPAKIEREISEIYKKINYGTEIESKELLKELGFKNRFDFAEARSGTLDALMSLTNAKYGSGHTKAYMSAFGAKEMEMFAHSFENRYVGNTVFKKVMPEVYEESINFIKSLEK